MPCNTGQPMCSIRLQHIHTMMIRRSRRRRRRRRMIGRRRLLMMMMIRRRTTEMRSDLSGRPDVLRVNHARAEPCSLLSDNFIAMGVVVIMVVIIIK